MSNLHTPGPQVVVTSGQPMPMVVPYPQVPLQGDTPGYASKCSTWLGIFQIVIGALCVVLQFIQIFAFGSTWGNFYSAAWFGALFIATGIVGCVAGKKKMRRVIVAHLVLSILASVCAFILLIISASAATVSGIYQSYYGFYSTLYITSLIMVVASLLEGILAIIASGISCHGLCCQNGPVIGHVPIQNVQGGQVIQSYPAQQTQQVFVMSGNQLVPVAATAPYGSPMYPGNPPAAFAGSPMNPGYPPVQNQFVPPPYAEKAPNAAPTTPPPEYQQPHEYEQLRQ